MSNSVAPPAEFRPKPDPFRSGILGAVVVMAVLFGSLYLVSVPTYWWRLVLVAHILALMVVAFWIARYFTTSVRIASGQVTLRTFPYPTRSLTVGQVRRFALAQVYVGATTDTHTHLAAVDANGKQLFRLRTSFWALDDIHRVAKAIGAR